MFVVRIAQAVARPHALLINLLNACPALVSVLLAGVLIPAGPVQAAASPQWVPGRVIVQPRAGVSKRALDDAAGFYGATVKGQLAPINAHVLAVPAGLEQAVAQELNSDGDIAFAERERLVEPSAAAPNDPDYSRGWHLATMQVTSAWDVSRGAGVTVAVLDTGIDASQPDLAGQLVLPGYNSADGGSDTSDVYGHGTEVAGVIGAVTNNGIGVASIAPAVHILPVRVTNDSQGLASTYAIAQGLIWAADHGAKVANISYNVSGDTLVQNAAAYMRSKGGVVVVAAGNSNADLGIADQPDIITVAATTSSDTKASWSNYGGAVDVSAPGVGIWTTRRGGTYAGVSGTSFASPATAAVAALVMSANPALSPDQVQSVLENSAVDLGAAGRDPYYGYGRVDAAAAVRLALATGGSDAQPPAVSITTPGNGTSVSTVIPVDVTASDNVSVTSVDLYAGGTKVGTDSVSPYQFSWNPTSVRSGQTVTLTAYAHDPSGNVGSATVTVTVVDRTPPVVTPPPDKLTEATGTLTAVSLGTASAVDDFDGPLSATPSTTGPFTVGTHTVTWTAVDAAGNVGTATQTVVVTTADILPPVVTPPPDITAEATGPDTSVTLGTGTAVDNHDGNLVPTPAATGPFTVGTHQITWSATDAAGNRGTATQRVTIVDTTPPVISVPATVTVPATGYLTAVALGHATAQDSVSGAVPATAVNPGPFTSGSHSVTWKATDGAGNTAQATQAVKVLPLANLGMEQTVGEGSTVTVTVYLTGPAASYPVKIPYVVSGTASNPQDDDAASGTLSIASGTQGSIIFHTVDNGVTGQPPRTVVFTLKAPTNAVMGSHDTQTVTITESKVAPTVTLDAAQGGSAARTIYPGNGTVTVTAHVRDPNAGSSDNYDWSGSDNALTGTIGSGGTRFSFDPQGLAPGVYPVRLTVTSSAVPAQPVSVRLLLRVKATPPVLSTNQDSNGDGRSDAADGYGDDDQDGIANYLDGISDPAVLQGRDGVTDRDLLTTGPGLRLALGSTALVAGHRSAQVSAQDVVDHGGRDGAAAVDGSDTFNYPGGLFDFKVTGLADPGQSVTVVIPQAVPIPANGAYRKYVPGRGWTGFVEDARNAIASAAGANGLCPSAGDPVYQSGLRAGDSCVELTIEDGGPNDADGARNGVIEDPSGIGVAKPAGATDNTAGGGSGGGSSGGGATGGGGGGCALNPAAPFDPTLLIVALLSAGYVARRRSGCR
ncbi:MAG: S8 family serine peptidase [Gammaproteobacteria bacterium]